MSPASCTCPPCSSAVAPKRAASRWTRPSAPESEPLGQKHLEKVKGKPTTSITKSAGMFETGRLAGQPKVISPGAGKLMYVRQHLCHRAVQMRRNFAADIYRFIKRLGQRWILHQRYSIFDRPLTNAK